MESIEGNIKWWYLHQLQPGEVRERLIGKCVAECVKIMSTERDETGPTSEGPKNEKDIVLEEVIKTYPERIETPHNTNERCNRFKEYLKDYIKRLPDGS